LHTLEQRPIASMTHFASADQQRPVAPTILTEDARLLSSAHPPIFLHCGWRTRGTWIWNRFRGLRGVTGYYEPLGERLAEIRLSNLDAINAESWPSGHKGLDRPYFDEFSPLLRPFRPGVPGYQTRFATEDFFAAPDIALPEMEHYVRGLLDVTLERGEQPVLKFSRSTGRIGWMRRHFPDAVHIVVVRDPFTQFASALRQFVWHEDGYFLAMPLLLLTMHRDLPLIRLCLRHMGLELPELANAPNGLAACIAYLRAGDPSTWYRGFLAFWAVTAASIPDTVDLVIDSDALARSGSYRMRCEIELARLTGQMVSFGDADGTGAETPTRTLSRHSEILRAHAGAEAFFAELMGTAWPDMGVMGHLARKLAEARSHALGAEVTWRASLDSGLDPSLMAARLTATMRAARTERELASVLNSRSWRMTAPLRWLRQSLMSASR
jgi:hypothetical protein